jgi:hypothetical protein
MAGLVPDISPNDSIFDSLKTITLAIDAARDDRHNTSQDLLGKLQLWLINRNPYDLANLVEIIEKMMLVAIRCGTVMEKRDMVSRQIDEIIKVAVLSKYPTLNSGGNIKRPSKSLTAHGIATQIDRDVSRLLKEKNIRYLPKQGLGVSAITKKVKTLLSWTTNRGPNLFGSLAKYPTYH